MTTAANPAIPQTPEAFARVGEIELCYDTFGEPGQPALLMIMGLGTQMVAWDDDFCRGLAARGYHVIRFDNRDVGRSTRLDGVMAPDLATAMAAVMQGRAVEAPYRLEDMARDAIGLLDHLGIDRAHVVGASMGGAIAQLLAIGHPTRLYTMASIMATSGAPGLPPPTPEAMALLFRPPVLDPAGFLESYRRLMAVLRGPGFTQDEARDIERAGRYFARGIHPAGTARQLAAIFASGSRREALTSVTVPTLVIHGDIDPLVPLECGRDTARAVPGAKIVVIEGMGHSLPISLWPRIIDAIAGHAVVG